MPTNRTESAVSATAWTLMNDEGPALGAFSLYSLDIPVWVAFTATTTPPADFDGALIISPTRQNGGIRGELIDTWAPGLGGQYIWVRGYHASNLIRVVIHAA